MKIRRWMERLRILTRILPGCWMIFKSSMFGFVWEETHGDFDSLTDKLQNVFRKLRSKGTITEADVKEAMKEVKRAAVGGGM